MKDEFTYKVVFWAMMGILVIAAWMAITVKVLNHADEIDKLGTPNHSKELYDAPNYDIVISPCDCGKEGCDWTDIKRVYRDSLEPKRFIHASDFDDRWEYMINATDTSIIRIVYDSLGGGAKMLVRLY